MRPAIAPIGLDYIAGACQDAGLEVELLDLGLADDPAAEMAAYFARRHPELVGLSCRNIDDCFWHSSQSFVPTLLADVAAVRRHTDAPVVLGGVGFSVCPRELLSRSGADFGIRGDGEEALPALARELRDERRWERVPGLLHVANGTVRANPAAWPERLATPTRRDVVDNATYFRLGGQIGVETKRGCGRRCVYCVDPLAKGKSHRLRDPAHVADEVASLLARGLDVLHLCDAEFNLPPSHAMEVCHALLRRGLGERVRWYAYLSVVPFPDELAAAMRRAGCVGINFTSDATHPAMLAAYRQPHTKDDLSRTVQTCRRHGIRVMLDLLLGGPGETPDTAAQTIADVKAIGPDCAGAALGLRVYGGTPLAEMVLAEGPPETNPNVRRRYTGPVDWLQPTFYVASALGPYPARLVRDLMGDDERFFPPADDGPAAGGTSTDHNYNENYELTAAIAAGARGAYWDILRRLRRPTEKREH